MWETESALQELIVKNGEVKKISAGIHPPFSKIEIQAGGRLICEKGANWLMLYTKGDLIIDGQIICRNFQTGLGSIKETSPKPDNETLEVNYPENAKGGDGADSYPYSGRGSAGTRGFGGKGTTKYGGGGASGRSPLCNSNSCKSYNANGNIGGIHPIPSLPKGGNGGSKKKYQNGGCVYFKVDGKLISKFGTIDVSGSRGDSGNNGEDSSTVTGPRGHVYNIDPGQGGGGAPGGDAGLVVIKIDANNIISKPRILKTRGKGGHKGLNGKTKNGYRNSQQIAQTGDYGAVGKPTVWLTEWHE